MTLWCIARSPLMIGADLTKLDGPTLELLTNDEVIAVDQSSTNNRQLFRDPGGAVGWVAATADGRGRYVALFNTRDPWVLSGSRRIWRSDPVSMRTPGQEVAFEVPVGGLQTVVLAADDSASPRFWWPPVFRGVRWVYGDGHEVRADRDYGSHGERTSGLAVPAAATALRGVARLDDAARENARGEALVFSAYGFTAGDLRAAGQPVPLDLGRLGIGGLVRIRDLWSHADLGEFSGTYSPEIEWHGARLYRVLPARP